MEENKIDKAKRELQGFRDVYNGWATDKYTLEIELLCMKFFKAGLKFAEQEITMKCEKKEIS